MSVGKRKKVQFKLATDILIRIDYSEKIKEQYDNNNIYFGIRFFCCLLRVFFRFFS